VSTRGPGWWPIPRRRTWRSSPSRRSTPAWPSAATAATSTPAWARSLTPGHGQGRYGSGVLVYSFKPRHHPERMIRLPLQQLAAAENSADRRAEATWACLPGGDCGCWLAARKVAAPVTCRTMCCSRRRNRRHREALRSVRKRCRALDLPVLGGPKDARALCRPVECVGDCGTGSDQRNGWPQAGLSATQSRGSGHAPVRAGVLAGRKSLYCARQPRRRRRRERGGGQFSVKAISTLGCRPELLWRDPRRWP